MTVKIIPRKKISPPVPESDRVWYLLLHLGVPSLSNTEYPNHMRLARSAASEVGVKLSIIPIISDHPSPRDLRYFLRFPYYRRRDLHAIRLAETVLNIAWVLCGPLGDPNEPASTLRIPRELVDKDPQIALEDLIRLERSREWPDRNVYFPEESIGSYTSFSRGNLDEVWRRLPTIISNDHLSTAVRFLRTSKENFNVYPGQIRDIVADPSLSAEIPSEETNLETALLSAFKALEAIIGDPPKDKRKLARKLRAVGLDPYEGVGYSDTIPLIDMIREFARARDTKAAHGSTAASSIRILELLEFQSCAEYVLLAAIDQSSDT
jgi:hypothetical protein